MDVMALLPYIALGMKYGPQIIALIQSATSNQDLVTKLATLPSDAMTVIQQIGTVLFPNVKGELKSAAGAIAAFDHAWVLWVQKACNMLLTDTPKLVEDGLYGPRTQARVKILQKSLNMEVIDGWVGKLTRSAIDHAIALLTMPTPSPHPLRRIAAVRRQRQ
jgi:hypothetical protein